MSTGSARSAEFAVEVRQPADRPELRIVAVDGEIDVFSSPKLKETLGALLDGGHDHLILDLQNVTYMDSSGLGVLVGVLKRVNNRIGAIELVFSNPQLKRIFEITGLSRVFPIHDSVAKAGRPLS